MITYSLFKHKDGRSPNFYCLYQHPLSERHCHFSCRTADEGEAREFAERRLPEIYQRIYRESVRSNETQPSADSSPLTRSISLSEFYEDYTSSYLTKAGHPLRERSKKVIRDGFHRLIDRVGDIYIQSLTTEQCRQFIHTGQPSARTAQKHYVNLRAALRNAVELGYLQSNPFDEVRCPRPTYTDEEIDERCFHAEQFQDFILKLKQRTPAQQRLRRMLILIYETGLRQGEARNIRHQWYDLDLGVLKVSSSRTFGTKARASTRYIPISKVARQMITEQLEANRSSAKEEIRDSPYLFPGPSGHVLTESAVRIPFNKERIRIFGPDSKVRIHGLRHALVTRLSLHGLTDRQIQEVSGHSSLEMIQRYSHMGSRLVDPVRRVLDETSISV